MIAILAGDNLTGHARAFERGFKTIALEAAQVQKNVRHAVIWNDKAIAAAHVEPLHEAINLDYLHIGLCALFEPNY